MHEQDVHILRGAAGFCCSTFHHICMAACPEERSLLSIDFTYSLLINSLNNDKLVRKPT
jgi:hypothetical protein